jgi:hypothetical protein
LEVWQSIDGKWQIVSLHYLEIKLEQYPVATFS